MGGQTTEPSAPPPHQPSSAGLIPSSMNNFDPLELEQSTWLLSASGGGGPEPHHRPSLEPQLTLEAAAAIAVQLYGGQHSWEESGCKK
jgi:hypothetical protein